MGIRGRKSTAELSIIRPAVGLLPEPPEGMSARQSELWRGVVATKPAGWWDAGSLPLLIAYVRAVEHYDAIAAELATFDRAWLAEDDGLKRFDRLTVIFDRLAKLIAKLATQMRLSQRSRYDVLKAATAARHATEGTRPWQRAKRVDDEPADNDEPADKKTSTG